MVRIRHRAPRARRAVRRPVSRDRLRLLLIGWLVVLLGAAGTVAFASEQADPTITFTNSGSPPTACNTAPDLSALTVPAGTKVTLINQTRVTVTVYIGTKAGVTLTDGQGVALTLKVGQHDVTMHPDCQIVGSTRPLVVTVVEAGATPTSTAATSTGSTGTGAGGTGSGGSHAGSPPAAPQPGQPNQGAGGQVPGAGPGDGGNATSGPPPAAGGGSPSAGSSDQTVALDADAGSFDAPFQATPPEDRTGLRLLAVIALICVLGVTAGIIRAILAQRAHSVVST